MLTSAGFACLKATIQRLGLAAPSTRQTACTLEDGTSLLVYDTALLFAFRIAITPNMAPSTSRPPLLASFSPPLLSRLLEPALNRPGWCIDPWLGYTPMQLRSSRSITRRSYVAGSAQ